MQSLKVIDFFILRNYICGMYTFTSKDLFPAVLTRQYGTVLCPSHLAVHFKGEKHRSGSILDQINETYNVQILKPEQDGKLVPLTQEDRDFLRLEQSSFYCTDIDDLAKLIDEINKHFPHPVFDIPLAQIVKANRLRIDARPHEQPDFPCTQIGRTPIHVVTGETLNPKKLGYSTEHGHKHKNRDYFDKGIFRDHSGKSTRLSGNDIGWSQRTLSLDL